MKNIYELEVEEYNELRSSGLLSKLFEGYIPTNPQDFLNEKAKYQLHLDVYNLLFDFADTTGADPSDIWDIFIEHRHTIIKAMQGLDDIDLDKVFQSINQDFDIEDDEE
jgi:hypothetical protein